uniref:Rho GTPase activating protein 6 n=1 Tax=Poecilia reticulata TaxID=8081 RepID=A0A3P9MZB7_POERE
MGERSIILCLGDITWNTSLGPSISLKPVPLQSLSELERVRLQDVAFRRLIRCHDLGCHITIPKYGHKHKKSLRKKLDSLSKEKSRDKETLPQAFGIPLSHVITNDRVHKLRHEHQREEQSNTTELMLSFLHLSSGFKRPNKELSSSNSSLSSTPESHNDSPLPSTPDIASWTSRRGGVSVDCITDLDDNQARLLEALQLSVPDEAAGNRKKPRDKKLSLNPIYRQVPRIVDLCCQHLEKNGTNFRSINHFMSVYVVVATCEAFVSLFRLADSRNFPRREFQKESTTGNLLHFDQLPLCFFKKNKKILCSTDCDDVSSSSVRSLIKAGKCTLAMSTASTTSLLC